MISSFLCSVTSHTFLTSKVSRCFDTQCFFLSCVWQVRIQNLLPTSQGLWIRLWSNCSFPISFSSSQSLPPLSPLIFYTLPSSFLPPLLSFLSPPPSLFLLPSILHRWVWESAKESLHKLGELSPHKGKLQSHSLKHVMWPCFNCNQSHSLNHVMWPCFNWNQSHSLNHVMWPCYC